MRITPRANEVKAVASILTSGEFDSPEAMAKAVIKEVGDLFSQREFYAWVYRENPDAYYLTHGPFSSDSEAKKFAGKYVDMLMGEHMILKLYSPTMLTTEMAKHKKPNHYCTTCEHTLVGHEHPKIQPRCAVRRCPCRKATTE